MSRSAGSRYRRRRTTRSWRALPWRLSAEPGNVWAVTCFYVDRRGRRRGLAAELLHAAVEYAAEHGADVVEGYPVASGDRPPADLYHGTLGLFTRADFELVERRGAARALVRRKIAPRRIRWNHHLVRCRAEVPPIGELCGTGWRGGRLS
ncbi:GNAT family N-acetyltransferase [Amycolatopsis sp. NPDC049253]|uniref:GNAT family N-acetyltransferase n=1 Tax=Amycolatopsis sp. NPDC049253 TaxID=3155274 RepID=UPI00342A77AD